MWRNISPFGFYGIFNERCCYLSHHLSTSSETGLIMQTASGITQAVLFSPFRAGLVYRTGVLDGRWLIFGDSRLLRDCWAFSFVSHLKRDWISRSIPSHNSNMDNNALFPWRRRKHRKTNLNKMSSFVVSRILFSFESIERESWLGSGGDTRIERTVAVLPTDPWNFFDTKKKKKKKNAWNMCYAFLLLLLSPQEHFKNFHPLANPFWRKENKRIW